MRRFFATSAGLAAGLVVSLVLVTPGGSNVASDISEPAEQPAVAAPAEPHQVAAAAAAAQKAGAPSSGVPTEGIKVHGRWTIEVRNSDGTLASRTEFNNALMPPGGALLSNVLARSNSVGKWAMELGALGAGVGPCGLFSCYVSETGSGLGGSFPTLTVSAPANSTVVLGGTATAIADGSIGFVATYLAGCAPSNPPSTPCGWEIGSPLEKFTSTTLATPVAVLNGQQIQVTVVISFQ